MPNLTLPGDKEETLAALKQPEYDEKVHNERSRLLGSRRFTPVDTTIGFTPKRGPNQGTRKKDMDNVISNLELIDDEPDFDDPVEEY